MFNSFKSFFVSSDSHISVNTAVDYIKAMIFQRVIQPDSKLALTEWLPLTPLNYFIDHGHELDLQTLYRSLDVLKENFHVVEKYLYHWATENYNQKNNELFYDITSSYFEGHKCIIAEYGYSRDKRSDKEQIVIGLVTTSDGFPIKCNIYPGNKPDKTTVSEVITELKRDYPIEEVVFVRDRGMLTANNITAIEELKQKYVMAIPRAWSKKYLKEISIDENMMQKIKDDLYATFIPPVDNHRFLLCLNISKREDDRQYRNHCVDAIKKELLKLNSSLGENKNIKTRDEAMKRAGSISKLNKAGKYFEIKTVDSTKNILGFELEYDVKSDKLEDDERLDGTFLIQTNKENYADEKLLKIYKNLSKVENAFKITQLSDYEFFY